MSITSSEVLTMDIPPLKRVDRKIKPMKKSRVNNERVVMDKGYVPDDRVVIAKSGERENGGITYQNCEDEDDDDDGGILTMTSEGPVWTHRSELEVAPVTRPRYVLAIKILVKNKNWIITP